MSVRGAQQPLSPAQELNRVGIFNFDEGKPEIAKIPDPVIRELVLRAFMSFRQALARGDYPQHGFDVSYFVGILARAFADKDSLQAILAGRSDELF